MIKKYSEVNELNKLIDESLIKLESEILNEGSIMDFLKMMKDTTFGSDIQMISPKQANRYKYLFAESFIHSLSSLKFKFWNATNIIFKPKEVIKAMQDELLIKIKNEWAGEYGKSGSTEKISDVGGRTRILFLDSKYPSNQPLIEELNQIMKYIKSNMESMLTTFLNRRFPSNPLVGNEARVNAYKDKFRTEFLTIFQPMNKKLFKSMDGKSQFEYVGYKLIKELNRDLDIDVKSMIIVPDKYASETDFSNIGNFPTSTTVKKDRIKSYLDTNPEGSFVTIIQEYVRRYNKPKVVPDNTNPEYMRYIELATMANDELKHMYAQGDDLTKQVTKDDIISRMNVLENSESYAKEQLRKEEESKGNINSEEEVTTDTSKEPNVEKGNKRINKPTAHALATEYMNKYNIPNLLRNKYFELAIEANEVLYDRVKGDKSKMTDKDIIDVMRELDVDKE